MKGNNLHAAKLFVEIFWCGNKIKEKMQIEKEKIFLYLWIRKQAQHICSNGREFRGHVGQICHDAWHSIAFEAVLVHLLIF